MMMVYGEKGDFDQIEQVSRLLQMPAGVSEHCSVVIQMIIIVMTVMIIMMATMMAWNELNNGLLVVQV